MDQTTAVKTNVATRSQQIGNTMLLEMDWVVATANEKIYEIAQTITRIQLTINSPGKNGIQITKIDTDSESKTTELGNSLISQIQPLIGATFRVSMTRRGEITDVTIPKTSLELIRLAPASMPIRELLTEAGLKDLLGQSAIVFPESEIGIGESWTMKSDLVASGRSRTDTIELVGSAEKDGQGMHEFKLKTEISDQPASTDDLAEPGVSKMSIEEFTGGGKILFSPDAPTMVESEMKNQIVTQRQYREKTIRTTVTTEVKMKVKRN